MRTSRLTLAIFLATSTALAAPPSKATADERERAQAHFSHGKELLAQKHPEAAIAELRASLEIVQSPNTRLALARALRELGRLPEACGELRRVEVEAKDDSRYDKAVEAAIAERLEIEPLLPAPEPARATEPVVVAPPIIRREVVVVEAPPTSPLRIVAYVAGGVALAGLTTFAVSGLTARATHADLEAACPANACAPGHESEIARGRSQQTIANVGLAVFGVGAAAALTFFVVGAPNRDNARIGAGLGTVSVRGAF